MPNITPRITLTPRRLIEQLRSHRPAPISAVHFHSGPQGAPAVCDDPRCASPRLDV